MSPENSPPQNILIVRTDRVGDVVLTLPMAEVIKKHFPGCRITFLLKDYTVPLVRNHPFIDDVIVLKQKENKPDFGLNLKIISNRRFDTCIIVNPSFKISLITAMAGIKQRIGSGYRWYSFLFTHKVYEHRKYAERHELEFNISLLQMLGINEPAPQIKFNLQVDETARKIVDEILRKQGIAGNKLNIIVHPGSGGSAVDLPKEKMKQLVNMLDEAGKYEILITGSLAEKELCAEMAAGTGAKNLAGVFSLSELIALIGKIDIFIANSTGPIHIAAALGKYVIGFYPNLLACSAKRWGPYTGKKVIFTPDKKCSNCGREQCGSPDCMSTIQIPKVFEEIEKICTILAK